MPPEDNTGAAATGSGDTTTDTIIAREAENLAAGGNTDAGDTSIDSGDTTGDQGDKGGDTRPPAGDWVPADWRDRLASGLPEDQRGKAKDYLKTRSSPYDILRSGMAADSKISELMRDRVKIPTGKNDDPKDVAAYRKARGVPEAPEKYDVRLPEDFGEMDALDTDLSNDFKKRAHALNWGQKDFDLAIETVAARDKMRAAEEANRILRAKEAAIDDLRVEFGRDYRGNVELINRFMAEEMKRAGLEDPEARRDALSMRFANGMALGEQPWFVKMMLNIARQHADDGIMEGGETADGTDVDGRIEAIMGKMHSDPKEYERMQPELQKLIATQNRRNARK